MQYQGRYEGQIEGEHNKAVTIARKMLQKNNSIKNIIELTDLIESEVKNIRKSRLLFL